MLTLQYVSYAEIAKLDSEERIKKILKIVKQNKIALLQGRLKPMEETRLIQETMEEISKDFKGIEVCTVYPQIKDAKFLDKIKKELMDFVLGSREGLTIVGPASVVKEIRRDPDKIQLFTEKEGK